MFAKYSAARRACDALGCARGMRPNFGRSKQRNRDAANLQTAAVARLAARNIWQTCWQLNKLARQQGAAVVVIAAPYRDHSPKRRKAI